MDEGPYLIQEAKEPVFQKRRKSMEPRVVAALGAASGLGRVGAGAGRMEIGAGGAGIKANTSARSSSLF